MIALSPSGHAEIAMPGQTGAEKQKHLLVVDDNLDLAHTYEALFKTQGYQVSVAGNGVLALKFLLDHAVDAIVCDLSMPQLDGDMFHLTVQRVRPHLARRFVFITGNVGNPRYETFLKNVGCPVLYKPVSGDEILETLKSVFAQAN
jgi:CheY-like chemotaxis protein